MKVLKALEHGPKGRFEILRDTGGKTQNLRILLRDMVERQEIVRVSAGVYGLPPSE